MNAGCTVPHPHATRTNPWRLGPPAPGRPPRAGVSRRVRRRVRDDTGFRPVYGKATEHHPLAREHPGYAYVKDTCLGPMSGAHVK